MAVTAAAVAVYQSHHETCSKDREAETMCSLTCCPPVI